MAVTQTARHVTGHFRRERRSCTPKIAAFPVSTGESGPNSSGYPYPGVGRADWDKDAYTKVVREALETFMKEKLMKVCGIPSAVVSISATRT